MSIYSSIISYCIRIDKPPNHRIIIPGLEVVQPSLLIIVVSPVANGIDSAEMVGIGDLVTVCVGDREYLATGIIGVVCPYRAVGV